MTASILTMLASIAAGAVLILRWWLSAKQKKKRERKYVRKTVEKMRELMANGDGTAIRDELRKLL